MPLPPSRCDKDCEESWEYVEFLKKDISDEVTEILTNFKTTQDGDKAVEETMSKVKDYSIGEMASSKLCLSTGYGCERNNLEAN